MTITANDDHPATYSAEVLPYIRQVMAQAASMPPSIFGTPRVLDPFGGTGVKLHTLADEVGIDSVAVELEPEWAACHPRNVHGDATALEFDDESFDIVATSPCYGNRMADDHENRDACGTCGGGGCAVTGCDGGDGVQGWGDPAEVDHYADVPVHVDEHVRCSVCKGAGLSRRNTYRHRLGRALSKGTAANLRFVAGPRGNKYRRLHERAWAEVHRVLRPYGVFVLNVSNHLETIDGQVVEHRCTEWHIDHLVRNGFRLEAIYPITTRRQKQGANGDTRPDHEFVIILRKR